MRALLGVALALLVASPVAEGRAEPIRPERGGQAVLAWPTDPVALGKLMAEQAGWTGAEWDCLFQVVDHESGWAGPTTWNRQSGATDPANDPNGAYGLPQSHPPIKLASAGADWRTSARTQLRWLIGYVRGRWRTPCAAWEHWQLFMRGGASYSY